MGATRRFTVVAVAVCACLAPAIPAQADAVWGTGLVFENSNAPGYEGYYEYCYHIYWDTRDYGGHGLSHSTIYLALADCECACDPGYFGHRIPAGLGFGEETCEVEMYSEFDCPGDPHFPVPGPTMKFEPDEVLCELGETGWMHVCYLSLFPPTEAQTFEDHLGIKFGQNVETGNLVGVLPFCECDANPVASETWGTIKSLYR
ncbi:MAG: hypothetical protein JXB46_10340 [Candidatus Eisenbacteria bacterium]|nr:hypothetical protein [Candidatus Eisenbacteria bacterium]